MLHASVSTIFVNCVLTVIIITYSYPCLFPNAKPSCNIFKENLSNLQVPKHKPHRVVIKADGSLQYHKTSSNQGDDAVMGGLQAEVRSDEAR